jgi:O-antigen ligase
MEGNKRITGLFLAGIIISSFIVSPYVLDMTLTSRFITLAVLLFFSVFVMYRRNALLPIKTDLPFSVYFLYTSFSCCSILWATNVGESLFENSKLILGFLVFCLTVFSLRQNTDFMTSLLKYSIVLFFMEVIVISIQCIGLPNFEKLSLYGITGLNGHKNLLSSFILLNLFFLIKALFKLQKPWKILAAIAILLSGIILFFLKTKAVWLGLGLAILTYIAIHAFLLLRKRIRIKVNAYIIIGIFMLLATIFFLKVFPLLIDKGLHYNSELNLPEKEREQAELDDERLTLWKKTYTVFEKHPFIGVGTGNWQIHYADAGLEHLWRAEDLNYTFQRPHNDWLWILSETGLVGFNLWLLFIISTLVFSLKAISTEEDPFISRGLALCIALLVGYLAASFFDFPHERIEHTIWINLLLAIAYHNARKLTSSKKGFEFTPHKLVYLATAGVLVIIAYIGILRHQGEFSLRKMYACKNRNMLPETIELCKVAESFAYNIDPTSVPISWYSGNAKAASGDYEAAQKDFIKAYKLNPYNRNVLNDLASSYVFTNNIELSKSYYREAARISPRFDDPKLNLAAIYIREENYKMALYWLKAVHHVSDRRSSYQKMVEMHLGTTQTN